MVPLFTQRHSVRPHALHCLSACQSVQIQSGPCCSCVGSVVPGCPPLPSLPPPTACPPARPTRLPLPHSVSPRLASAVSRLPVPQPGALTIAAAATATRLTITVSGRRRTSLLYAHATVHSLHGFCRLSGCQLTCFIHVVVQCAHTRPLHLDPFLLGLDCPQLDALVRLVNPAQPASPQSQPQARGGNRCECGVVNLHPSPFPFAHHLFHLPFHP